MRNFCYPFVPMLVHQIIDYTAGGLGKAFKKSRVFVFGTDQRTEYDFGFIGRNLEAHHSVLHVADTLHP